MRYLVLILLFCLQNTNSQNNPKAINKNIKKNTMEYFNIEKYKDWEIDTDFSQSADTKFLKKGNDRVEINFNEKVIQVESSNTLNPYMTIKLFSKDTKRLKTLVKYFDPILIDKMYVYNEIGEIIEETDYDQSYAFTLKQVIEKIKKEENVDLEDKKQRGGLQRFIYSNNKPFYEVSLKTENENAWNYIIIDGNTGESLFRTTYFTPDDDYDTQINPFDQYLEIVKKKEAEDNAYYRTYKGKDYTKKEWEDFKEEWHKDYLENKNKGFWDDIFKWK